MDIKTVGDLSVFLATLERRRATGLSEGCALLIMHCIVELQNERPRKFRSSRSLRSVLGELRNCVSGTLKEGSERELLLAKTLSGGRDLEEEALQFLDVLVS